MVDLTPNDIVNKEFRRAFRGYSPEQVDDFLQQVSEAYFAMLEENKRVRAQVDEMRALSQQFQETESLLKNTLVLAERTAEETRRNSREEADLMRREAEQQITGARAQLDELRQTRLRMLAELRAMLQAHLLLLDAQEQQ